MNRGSIRKKVDELADLHASMRPRFMNRGSHVPAAGRRPDPLASMRPRFMNRGSKSMKTEWATGGPLQ